MQKIIVISAPSGGGKTTLIRALLQNNPQLQNVITHTTRPPRNQEIHKVHYHFVDVPTFKAMIQNDDFVEWAQVYGHYYGTSKTAINTVLAQGKIPILNIDWQGAQNVRKIYGKAAVTVFILPPSLTELEKRLRTRGDSAENIQKRLATAEAEIAHAEEYDFVVTNDNFETALLALAEIARNH